MLTLVPFVCYSINIMENKGDNIMKLGTKIIGNFGAMIPLWMGSIYKVDKETKFMDAYAIDVKWENGSITKMMTSDLIANGEGIGYMTEEAYYNG